MPKKATALYCAECGVLLGVNFRPFDDAIVGNWCCSHCATSIGRMADTLAIITGGYAAGLPNVPSEQDIDKLYIEGSIEKQRSLFNCTKDWCYEQREIIAKEKASKLLKRS